MSESLVRGLSDSSFTSSVKIPLRAQSHTADCRQAVDRLHEERFDETAAIEVSVNPEGLKLKNPQSAI